MVKQFDFIVVGAGPSGAIAARSLAARGYDVAIIEKHQLPRVKVCGGGLNAKLFDKFPYLRPIQDDFLESESYGIELHSPSLQFEPKYESKQPLVLMTLRNTFDHRLTELAEEAGATLTTMKVENVKTHRDHIVVTGQDGLQVQAQAIIGADGAASVVASRTGLADERRRRHMSVGVEAEIEVGEKNVEACVGASRPMHVFFFPELLGYAWLFPKRSHLNIGVGGTPPGQMNLRELFYTVLRILRRKKLIPAGTKVNGCLGALLPVGGIVDRPQADRVLLCGDAAGCAQPMTGEGIYFAMISGNLAAEALNKGAETGDFHEESLSSYKNALWKEYGGEHRNAFDLILGSQFFSPLLDTAIEALSLDNDLMKTVIDYNFGFIGFDEYVAAMAMKMPFIGLELLYSRLGIL